MPETIDTEAIKYQLKRTYPTKTWLTSPFPYIESVRDLFRKKKKKKKKATLKEAYEKAGK